MHLQDLPILPRVMVGLVGVCNSKTFHRVEMEPEMMISHHLGEFSITSRPRRLSRPALGPPTPASSPARS
ncbi:40S ribosomal protein S15 [Myotis brandtii]|uniref:40S ribosomal protein S15 n=1 Tax=Myotis brandtii TaxID=109478 RepID=S7NUJ7_MYOBR|nr:40S ribosomal protein S15 [Myotis brandtii]